MRILKCLALALSLTAGAAEVSNHETAGIGVVLGVKDHNFIVMSILPDSPAAIQKDIHVGDRIVAVAQDGEPAVQVQDGKLAQAIALIRGPKGTTVRLTIVPAGENDTRVQVVSFVRSELKELSNGIKAPDTERMGGAARSGPNHASHHWLVVAAVVLGLAGTVLFFIFRRK
jgi:C-terminal processing protease CtpA/Prc